MLGCCGCNPSGLVAPIKFSMTKRPEEMPEDRAARVEGVAQEYGATHNTDVVLYNAPIDNEGFYRLAEACIDQDRVAQNVLLILCTFGGRAEAAYKSARFLQDNYKSFTVFIPNQCKSAGTILAIGANKIVMSDFGELGPLDVQVLKQDEFLELSSGAAVVSALELLQEKSFSLFEKFMLEIKERSGGAVTLRTSTDIAASMTVGLFKEIFRQIDPNYLGEMSRNLRVAYEYGRRLAEIGGNITPSRIHQLVYGYPNHEFVIDRREATDLFHHVDKPDKILNLIQSNLDSRVAMPRMDYDISLLSGTAATIDDQAEQRALGRNCNLNHSEGETDDRARDTDAPRAEAENRAADRQGANEQGNEDSSEIDPATLHHPPTKQDS